MSIMTHQIMRGSRVVIERDQHKYPAAGHCIYCGATDCKLSDEHIVPLALSGGWVLPKSSCDDCSKKTQQIEEVCTAERWGMFFPLRAKFKLRSRKGSTRRGTIKAPVISSDRSRLLESFPVDGFPAIVCGMILPPAGILRGEEPKGEIQCRMRIRTFLPTKAFDPKLPVQIQAFRPIAFVQLLAKIGYSFAAAELGRASLLSELADVILVRTEKSPYCLVGGDDTDEPPADANYLHRIELKYLTIGDDVFTLVLIHLLAQFGMPRYHVVVGHCRLDEYSISD